LFVLIYVALTVSTKGINYWKNNNLSVCKGLDSNSEFHASSVILTTIDYLTAKKEFILEFIIHVIILLVKKAKEKKTILPQLISQMKNLLAIKLGPLYLKLNYIIILLKMIK
jgi:hypothetical protein